MGFCDRFILKDVQDFQKLTARQKQQYVTLHAHQHVAAWFADLFVGIVPGLESDYLIEKLQNLCLLNRQVISFKDWNTIKKKSKKLYHRVRSEACNHTCYVTTYEIADALKDPEIKILWIAAESASERFGHAVLLRNSNIYDSNLRKTFKQDVYFQATNAKVFKEYSLEEYSGKSLSHKSVFFYLQWKAFGKWCIENGVKRNIL